MIAHIRACFFLLVFTVVLCCVFYPLALWGIGQGLFAHQANGSLVYAKGDTKKEKPIGSQLIAQGFSKDEYFQPRPSSPSYNAATSGATNWAANNYLLRDRVARAVSGLTTYRSGPNKGKEVAPDVVKWFREEKPDLAAAWAKDHSTLAQNWVKTDDATKDYVADWFKRHPADLEAWRKDNAASADKKVEEIVADLAGPFFEGFSKENPGAWLREVDKKDAKGDIEKDAKGEPVKLVEIVKKSDEDSGDVAAVFFDAWRQAHPDADLTDVPADMVTASASGLDPDITLEGALFQLDRVAGAWAKGLKQDEAKLRGEIETLLKQKSYAPLAGLAGVPMLNVLEVNMALTERYGALSK